MESTNNTVCDIYDLQTKSDIISSKHNITSNMTQTEIERAKILKIQIDAERDFFGNTQIIKDVKQISQTQKPAQKPAQKQVQKPIQKQVQKPVLKKINQQKRIYDEDDDYDDTYDKYYDM